METCESLYEGVVERLKKIAKSDDNHARHRRQTMEGVDTLSTSLRKCRSVKRNRIYADHYNEESLYTKYSLSMVLLM